MLNKKYFIILTIFLVGFLAVSSISAAENVTGDIDSIGETSDEIISIDETPDDSIDVDDNQENITDYDNYGGSFYDLKQLVYNADPGDVITLDTDYLNAGDETYVSLNKELTIDGKGHIIDANFASRAFYVSADGVTLKNIVFINAMVEGSYSGGAVYSTNDFDIINSTFIDCYSAYNGGAVYTYSEVTCNIIDSKFVNCYSENNGGAFYAYSSSTIYIENSSFYNCSCEQYGGAVSYSSSSNAEITDSTFKDCSSNYSGGAIYAYSDTYSNISNSNFYNCSASKNGGAVFSGSSSTIYVSYSRFRDCEAKNGGGIYLSLNSNSRITNSDFINCSSESDGGAIYLYDGGRSYITDSHFTGCSAEYGGAVSLDTNAYSEITSSTFYDCSADYAGAIYINEGAKIYIESSAFESNFAKVIGGSLFAKNMNEVALNECNFTDCFAEGESGGAIAVVNSTLYAYYMQFIECGSEFGGALTLLSSYSDILQSYFRKNNATYYGGAILAMYGSLYCANNQFYDDSALKGGAIYLNQVEAEVIESDFINNIASYGNAVYEMNNQVYTPNTYTNNNFSPNNAIYSTFNNNLTVVVGDQYQLKITESSIGSIPSYYNMADYNLLTPVKDQGEEGNCWAFAAIATLESCILKASNITFDLSEANMKNLLARYSDYGDNIDVNDGGNRYMAVGYLASGLGPVLDIEDIYYINDYLSPLLKSIFYIQNAIVLERSSYTDNDAIKEAILKYGAVATSMHYNSSYLKNNVSYYFSGNYNHNHAVTIVGWDDNYSKYKFKTTPAGDGAWIVRNSWGPDWGDNGYFYVSYYDTQFAEPGSQDSYTFILNDTTRFNKVYQYEIENTAYILMTQDGASYKNVFTAEGNEYITAVSTYAKETYDYVVKIYVNDVLKATKSGKAFAGYYTVNLDSYISINKDDKVDVVFECSNFENGRGRIPYSEVEDAANLYTSAGKSFYKSGGKWVDITDSNFEGMICIKMFTSYSPEEKLNPYFEVESHSDYSDNTFLIKVILPCDATGTVQINTGNNIYNIDLAVSRSIKLYNLDETNNTLSLTYSGDYVYMQKNISHVVNVYQPEPGTFEEFSYLIYKCGEGGVVNIVNDCTFTDFAYTINITKSITIDGHGHTINANHLVSIFNIQADNVVLKNIILTEARADEGGAVTINGIKCSIINCTFENNNATDGGAIKWVGEEGLLINSSFKNNKAENGGAVYLDGDYTEISGCEFINNGGGAYGGAIYSNSTAAILNCTFIGNSAELGGSVWLQNFYGNLTNCSFISNYAPKRGGAVFALNDYTFIDDCLFEDNVADKYGGAIIWGSGYGYVINSSFKDNSAGDSGGAVMWWGGGYLSNSTFTTNTAEYGGAVYWYNDYGVLSDSKFIDNSAIYRGHSVYWNSDNGSLVNSTFVNNLGKTQIVYWHSENGTISGCKFINTTKNNVYVYAGEFIKNQINLTQDSQPFEYNSPKAFSINFTNLWSDIPIETPVLRLTNGKTTKDITLSITNNVAVIYDELFGLEVGTWTASVSIEGDDNYCQEDLIFEIEVRKAASSLNLTVTDTLVATVLDSDNITINEGTVSFYDGDMQIAVVNVENGVARLDYTPAGGGEHVITANFTSSHYMDSSDSVIIKVDAASVEVTAAPGTVGFNSTFVANVTGLYSIVNEGIVSFYLDDEFIGSENVLNGIASITYMPLTAGDYAIRAVFTSVSYGNDENTTIYTVNRADSSINVDDVTANIDEYVTLTAKVTSTNGLTISEGTVTFKEDETVLGVASVKNGTALLTYKPEGSGLHNIFAVFNSDNYLSSNDTARVMVDMVMIEISATPGTVGFNSTITAHVQKLFGNVNEGSVSFYIDDEFIGRENVTGGYASASYRPLLANEYVIKAVFNGVTLPDNENTTVFAVSKADSLTLIDDVTGTAGNNLTLIAHVTSSNGLTINDGIVKFLDGENIIGEAQVIDGFARFTYVPEISGEYTITAIYDSDNYLSSNDTARVLVDDASIEISSATATVGFNSTLTARVTALYGTIDDGYVEFYFNDEFIGNVTPVNGEASISYAPLTAGNYTLKAVYTGSAKFREVENTTVITVEKANSIVTLTGENATVGHNITLTAVIESDNGLTISEGTVTFLNGEEVLGNANVVGGVAELVYAPPTGGKYTITAIFDSDNYLSSNDTADVFIDDANIEIILTPATVGFNSTLTARVTALYGTIDDGCVEFYFNDEFIGNVTPVNGEASISYAPLTAGNNTLKAVYTGSAKYRDVENTTVYTVEKANSIVTLTGENATVGHNITLTAVIESDNGLTISEGTVTFLNGEEVLGKVNVVSGVAELVYAPQTGGKYTITAIFDSDNYLSSNDTADVFIDAVNIEITVTPATVGFSSTLTANVTALYSIIDDGSVEFYFNDEFIEKVALVNGGASINYVPLTAGNNNLRVVYTDSTRFLDAENTTLYNVDKADSSMLLNGSNGTAGHELTLTVTLSSSNGLTINDGVVIFKDGDAVIGQANVINGNATLKYTPATGGEHDISATYNSDNYMSSNGTVKLFIDAIEVGIITNPATVGFNTTITATVTALYSTVNEGSVSFYINDIFIQNASVIGGVTTISYQPLAAGNHILKAVYSESTKFLDEEKTVTYTVNKADSSISFAQVNGTAGHEITFNALITSSNNLSINDGTVTFMDGNNVIGVVNVKNNAASLKYTPATGGEHTITATFDSNNYNTSAASNKIYVDDVNIVVTPSTGVVGYESTFTVNVNALYSVVNEGIVNIYVNDELAGTGNVTNGAVTFSYTPLSAGTKTFRATYTGSSKFLDKETSADYTVNQASNQLTVNNISGTVGRYVTLTATVVSPNNLVVNDGTVTFLEGDVLIGRASVSNGVARYTYAPQKAGNHTISAKYEGINYAPSSATAKSVISKAITSIQFADIQTVYYSDHCVISVNVTSYGNLVTEGLVKFYIAGQMVKSLIPRTGQITFNYTCEPGTYTILAVFGDSSNYLPSNATANFTVDKLPTTITAAKVSTVYNGGKYLVVYLKDIHGKAISDAKVIINLNGVKTVVTDSNGMAKLSTNGLAPKTYTAIITFAGDSHYAKKTLSVKVTVKKATPKMTAKKKTFKKKVKVKKYAVTLKVNGKVMKKTKVTLKVNKKKITAKTNSKGKVTFKIKNLKKKGKYSAVVTYKGNKYYKKVTKKVKITVK